MINKKTVTEYYNKWTGRVYTNDKAISFYQMLEQKAQFAYSNGRGVYAFDGLKTYKELEKMIDIFNQLLVSKPELRGY